MHRCETVGSSRVASLHATGWLAGCLDPALKQCFMCMTHTAECSDVGERSSNVEAAKSKFCPYVQLRYNTQNVPKILAGKPLGMKPLGNPVTLFKDNMPLRG
jgi:hypothetical protein